MTAPTQDNLRLSNQLCFALYAATNAITRAYRVRLGRLGLTYPQYLVLLVLWEGGAHTVKSVADALQLDSSTATPLLKRLEAAGWVTRQRDDSDERVVRIILTTEGRALRRPVSVIQKEVVCLTQMTSANFDRLRKELCTLATSLGANASV